MDDKTGICPANPLYFDGTIAENIAFEMDKKNIDTNQVLKCCHMAAMDDFLNELPLGIDHILENAVFVYQAGNVSGFPLQEHCISSQNY
jgi:ABC-type bacteriocin/lantibiotic exporters, contain an N-terminal double-glycine peptidase domain